MRRPEKLASKVVLVAAAGCALLAAASARAQVVNADVGLTATPPKSAVHTSTAMAVKVDVANAGPSNATGVVIDATVPANLKVSAVSGCTPNDTSATPKPLPCTVTDQGNLGAGVIPEQTKATVTITVALTSDAAKAILAAGCPDSTVSLGTVTITAATTTTDPATANNTATAALPGVAQFADVGIAYTAEKDTANEGETLTFTGTITNKGPCVAPAVVATTATTMMTYVDGTGACPGDPAEKDCNVGDMAVNQSAAFTRRYKIDPPPGSDAADGAYAHFSEIDVASNDITDDAGNVTTPAAWDPTGSNDSARPIVTSNHTGTSGCASGGRGVDVAVLAAIPALLLFARAQRRRLGPGRSS